mmetsp:Transcript_15103/g.21387  ORF Transcript_15103/g.21387 Transcript_15103/m.21387 type:complete len:428 (+) Transcript_15103:68-1351(+)
MSDHYPLRTRKKRLPKVRLTLLAIALGYNFRRLLRPILLPYGNAVRMGSKDRPVFGSIDYNNDSLQGKHGKLSKIYERVPDGRQPLIKGPETVIFGKDHTMYVTTEDSRLLSLTDIQEEKEDENGVKILTAKTTEVAHLGFGRPLGGAFTKDGNTLYISDVVLGLIRVNDFKSKKAKVELVASRVKVDDEWSPITFADDVTIGPKTGMVYFSDASDLFPERDVGKTAWDPMYMSKIDCSRGKGTGRLLRYDPSTDDVDVLADGIFFANGVTVDKDETFIMVSETFQSRALKYYLEGEKKGTVEVMADKFPGYPDGADCTSTSGMCYVPLASSIPPVVRFIFSMPHPIDMILRAFVMMLPKKFLPEVVPYGGIVEISPGDSSTCGQVTRIIQDPTGKDIGLITGVTFHQGKIYLGSLHNDFVGVYDLD